MQNSSFEVIDLLLESATAESYDNRPIAKVNDHEVRISTMTEAYHWHCHPDSDESFLALEDGLCDDFRIARHTGAIAITSQKPTYR